MGPQSDPSLRPVVLPQLAKPEPKITEPASDHSAQHDIPGGGRYLIHMSHAAYQIQRCVRQNP